MYYCRSPSNDQIDIVFLKMNNIKELREEAYKGNKKLSETKLSANYFGNLSCIDRNMGLVAIKPTGEFCESIGPDEYPVLDIHGNIVDAPLRPSVDTCTHIYLYQCFPNINSVAHSHSTYATAWAQTGLAVPCFGTTHADYARGQIPCTKFLSNTELNRYEHHIGASIKNAFSCPEKYKEIPMVLVAGHGPFAWGSSITTTIINLLIVEKICNLAFLARAISPELSPLKEEYIGLHYSRNQDRSQLFNSHGKTQKN